MRFSKYHGLGNDFILVDLRAGVSAQDVQRIQEPAVVRQVCDRRFGVGADGVLAILPAPQGSHGDPAADARMRVLNADGSEAEMCGNGLRCVVKYLYDRDPALRKGRLAIHTGAGVLACDVTVAGSVAAMVTVDMGRPRLTRGEIPMTGPAGERCIGVPLDVAGAGLAVTAVSMGNPHAIAFMSQSGAELLAVAEAVGPAVEHHPWFPHRTNVELARMHSATDIELVVWERGCGITLACGTGACATAVAACLSDHAQAGTELTVRLLGGELAITVAQDYRTVYMRGPATHVFDAELPGLA